MNPELKVIYDQIHPFVNKICDPLREPFIEDMFDSRLEASGCVDGVIIGSTATWDECWTRTWNEMFILMIESFRSQDE